MKTRRLTSPWPFPSSVTEEGMVRNLPPKVKKPPRQRLKRVPSSDKWTQEALL